MCLPVCLLEPRQGLIAGKQTCLSLSWLSCTQALLHSTRLAAAQDNSCSDRSCCNLIVQIPHMDGVAKIDLEEQDPKKAVAGVYRFEDAWVGGESYFVPASEDPAACNGEQALSPLPSFQVVRCFCWAWVPLAFALPGWASKQFSTCPNAPGVAAYSCHIDHFMPTSRPASDCCAAYTLQVRMTATWSP